MKRQRTNIIKSVFCKDVRKAVTRTLNVWSLSSFYPGLQEKKKYNKKLISRTSMFAFYCSSSATFFSFSVLRSVVTALMTQLLLAFYFGFLDVAMILVYF